MPGILDKQDSSGSLIGQYTEIAKKNDAYWYERISDTGYPVITSKRDLGYSEGENYKQSEWAFFPFYPALNKATIKIFNTSFNTSAFWWSMLFSLLAILGLYRYGLIYYKNDRKAFFNALLLFSFPFSFYFSMYYTEALYFTFMIYSFISISSKRYIILALLLIPLTLIRPNGIIIIIPLYLYFLERIGILQKYKLDWQRILSKEVIITTLAFITAPLTFLAYGIYQYQYTGFFFAFSIAQDGWYRELSFPILAFFRKGDVATQFNSFYTIFVILFAAWAWRKLPLSLNILVLLSLLLPLCSGSVTSMTRFISVIFPLFLVLSETLNNLKYRYIIIIIIIGLHFLSYYTWMTDHPISF